MEFCDRGVKPDPSKQHTQGGNHAQKPAKGQLINYILSGPNEISLFNGVSVKNAKGASADTFQITGLDKE